MGPPGPGGFGGPGMNQEMKLVEMFDKDGNGWLNAEERKTAREYLANQGAGRRFGGPGRGPRGFGPFGPRQEQAQPKKGISLSPREVKWYPDAPLYSSDVLRTLFLEFENADWEQELADFKNTDVQVPARLVVDGKTYRDVGVHYHGTSSFMGVPDGSKRSIVLTLDFIHRDQNLGGYRKLLLLNSHEDPSFLRTVLAFEIARDYMPAPKANHVRLVINGESWGVYVNQQFFNKDFLRDWFGTTKGARWKVPGSPNGRGGLNYMEDPSAYRRIYEIKSNDDPKAWAELVNLCKVLSQTPLEQLEDALNPLLDIDATLRFLAWENVIASGDAYYARASDYHLYNDDRGRFHIIPYDANESFPTRKGPGGPGGPGGPFGPGGPRGFGPGMLLAQQMLSQADSNNDGQLSKEEFIALAGAWFDKLDKEKKGSLTQQQFADNLAEVLPAPQPQGRFGPPGTQDGRSSARGQFGPARFVAPGLFAALDANKDDALSRSELTEVFAKWFDEWDTAKTGKLNEDNLRNGLSSVMPQPGFGGGPRGDSQRGFRGQGGPGGRGFGPGGPGFGPGGGGANLDPLVAVNDPNKPLCSRLLAVPALRARYLAYVRDMAEKWLDWNRLGPLAKKYHDLIADDVKLDTKKLDTYEDFESSLSENEGPGVGTGATTSLKSFVEQRRAFLLNHEAIKNLPR
ncbi:MAG TPA: CotH kinase family protein [Verrucomicrobiota bacterium]|nr:CotH kinase family protein [Verrucomicrobiota bacterium]